MSGVPWEERCRAKLKYVYSWRCSRRAVHDGLCRQHYRHDSIVPAGWTHAINKHGVDRPFPVPPFTRVRGRRAPETSP